MSFILKILRYVKGRPVVIDKRVSVWYLGGLALEKFLALVRGVVKTGRVIFIGRGTTVRASSFFFAEKGVEISNYCQIDCLSLHGLFIGRGSKIGSYCIVKVSGTLSELGQKIEIGRNVAIGDFAHIGGAGFVQIGNDTITGSYLSIHPENHNFEDDSVLIRLQGVTRQGVRIGRNCWIGAKVTFLDGSSIGDGCVVAAGAVVAGVFPDRVVIGGVPAHIIKRIDRAATE